MRPNLLRENKDGLDFRFWGNQASRSQSGTWGDIFSFEKKKKQKNSFVAFTSIEDHKGLDVTRCQLREELVQLVGKSVILSPVLLVQKVVKVEAEVEAAAVDDQVTVPEPHVLEDMPVLLHEGGQTLDSHEASESAETQHWVTVVVGGGGVFPSLKRREKPKFVELSN